MILENPGQGGFIESGHLEPKFAGFFRQQGSRAIALPRLKPDGDATPHRTTAG